MGHLLFRGGMLTAGRCTAWSLLLDTQSSCVVLLVVLGLVRCLRWKMGTKLGRSQLHGQTSRRLFADSVFFVFFTGSEHLTWTYCETPENTELVPAEVYFFWVMGVDTIANDRVKLYNFKYLILHASMFQE